jgi:hypothetical protein
MTKGRLEAFTGECFHCNAVTQPWVHACERAVLLHDRFPGLLVALNHRRVIRGHQGIELRKLCRFRAFPRAVSLAQNCIRGRGDDAGLCEARKRRARGHFARVAGSLVDLGASLTGRCRPDSAASILRLCRRFSCLCELGFVPIQAQQKLVHRNCPIAARSPASRRLE